MSSLVLHVRVVTGPGGGPDKTIVNSPRYLADRGYPMVCAFMRHPEDPGFVEIEERARRKHAAIIPVDDRGVLDIGVLARLNALCARHRPAIWHAHDYKSELLGLLLRRHHPDMRLVTTVHGFAERNWRTRLYYGVERLCLPRYDQVVCVSEALRETCLRWGVVAGRLWYVPNAIDVDEFRRTRPAAEAKAALGLNPQIPLVGMVGRLSHEKRVDVLLRAVADLATRGRRLAVWLVGDGVERASLERLTTKLGLEETVHFAGFRSDTVAVYEAMDLFVLASLREGIPNSILEAMALEVPCVCTAVGGVPQILEGGAAGVLVEPESPEALARAIARLLDDASGRARYARAGRLRVETEYGFSQRMERIRQVYERVLGRGEIPSAR